MGIPSFYRWLVERYPRCVIDAAEDSPPDLNAVTLPIDTTTPNPNGFEFDNLYLDMNGIIHPCFHPEDAMPPHNYDEVFQRVFAYIDRIFSVIRPRKLLFLAIDGVAPRAKMNQQRARRFRASKDLADQESATQKQVNVPEAHVNEENEKLDSNIITPGTEFMELLSSALQYYIHLRMNNDPGWKGIKVILSDSSVPGEGEHKIVSYIRLQRNLPGFDPNTRHCLYGLDADLIMLALATHEVHFTVLREAAHISTIRKQYRNSQPSKRIVIGFDKYLSNQRFQLVRIWVLRDYLAHELQIPDPNVNTDFERLIDDFVFMCIFVGNDFLPHVPSLEIAEGGIDLLMMTYKQEFVQMGGYLTMATELCDSCVNLDHVEHFIKAIGRYEGPIFRKRNQIAGASGRKEKSSLQSSSKQPSHRKTQKGKHVEAEDIVTTDKVKLGDDGWRERYYAFKFEAQSVDKRELIRKHAVTKYVEGICWVMHYYYQGICSWNWFYPYHYAPFASDFQGIGQLEISFHLGKPLKPFDQLMGVLPAASAQALPFSYRQFMTDPSSPILDFYPTDFEVDLNGKRHSWQGVCKLPFIDEFRLLAAISKVEHTLTDPEVRRNSLGQDVLFIYEAHPLATFILSFREDFENNLKLPESAVRKEINPELSGGMNGYMYIPEKAFCPADIDSRIGGLEIIKENKVISVFYEVPSSHPHISKLPDGLIMPSKFICKDDIHPPAILWHDKTAVMESRCAQRPKPPNCISGPCLAKMAHRLVSENHGGENVSETWQKWLNKKKGEAINTRVKTMLQICLGKSTGSTNGITGKRKRDCRGESLKNLKKVKSSGDDGEMTSGKIASQCDAGSTNGITGKRKRDCKGEEKEKDGAVKLTQGQKKNLRRIRNKIKKRNDNEMSKVQSSFETHDGEMTSDKIVSQSNGETIQFAMENHGKGEEREKDGAVKLTQGQKTKLRRIRNKIKKRNNNEMSKVQSSFEAHDGEMTSDKIVSQSNGETIQFAMENHGKGEEREKDGAVKLTRSQKFKLRSTRSKMNKRNDNEMSKVQSSFKNHDGEMTNDETVSQCNGETIQIGVENDGNDEEREKDGAVTNACY